MNTLVPESFHLRKTVRDDHQIDIKHGRLKSKSRRVSYRRTAHFGLVSHNDFQMSDQLIVRRSARMSQRRLLTRCTSHVSKINPVGCPNNGSMKVQNRRRRIGR